MCKRFWFPPGQRLLFSCWYPVCWCKVEDTCGSSPPWLSYSRVEYALQPWQVCCTWNLRFKTNLSLIWHLDILFFLQSRVISESDYLISFCPFLVCQNHYFMVGLNVLCQGSLMTVEVFNRARAGINGLVSSFVKLLQVKTG